MNTKESPCWSIGGRGRPITQKQHKNRYKIPILYWVHIDLSISCRVHPKVQFLVNCNEPLWLAHEKKNRFWDFGHSYWEYLWKLIWNLGNILQNTLEWQLGWPIIKGSSEIVDTTIGNILRNSFGTRGNVPWTHWVLKATSLEHIGNIKNQKNSNPLAAPSSLNP